MRTLCTFLLGALLLCAATAARAVRYDQGPAIGLSVRASTLSTGPGQSVRLSVSARDTDYEVDANDYIRAQIDDPVTISWDAIGGRLQKLTGSNNAVELSWLAPAEPGRYVIVFSATDSGRFYADPPGKQVVEIEVARAGGTFTPSIRVAANPQTIRLDKGKTSIITAQVLSDKPSGQEVRFFATRGSLSAASVISDANGMATVRLTAGERDLGSSTVVAYYRNTASSTTVEIVAKAPAPAPYPPAPPNPPAPPSANPPGFLVSVEPSSLPADGQSIAVVSVRLTDLRGLGIPNQIVTFRSTLGALQPMRSKTDYYGFARVQLIAPTVPGVATIVVDSGAMTGYANATFTAPEPENTGAPRIFLSVDPTELPADGASKMFVEALVLDAADHAMVNTPVTFSTSLGTLQATTVTTGADGRATVALTAPSRPGLGRVAAQVGQTIAASQVTFQGVTTASTAGLDIRGWSGQITEFVAGNWILQQLHAEAGTQSSGSQSLSILDANTKVVKEFALGSNSVLIRDQYGVARGYTSEENDKAQLILLKADGSPLRAPYPMNLPLGGHIVDARYAEPAGHLLVAISQPDGTKPEVQFISPNSEPLQVFRDGLEKLPVMALGGDGHLAVAFPGGTVRLYAPVGTQLSEAQRKDGLPATLATVGPGGGWYAVASAQENQSDIPPKITIFTRQGAQLAVFDLWALGMAPAGTDALAVSTVDRMVNINLLDRRIRWSQPGGFVRFVAGKDYGVIAGQYDAKTGMAIPRILVVRLSDGQRSASQEMSTAGNMNAVLPPDSAGQILVVTGMYTLKFSLPAVK